MGMTFSQRKLHKNVVDVLNHCPVCGSTPYYDHATTQAFIRDGWECPVCSTDLSLHWLVSDLLWYDPEILYEDMKVSSLKKSSSIESSPKTFTFSDYSDPDQIWTEWSESFRFTDKAPISEIQSIYDVCFRCDEDVLECMCTDSITFIDISKILRKLDVEMVDLFYSPEQDSSIPSCDSCQHSYSDSCPIVRSLFVSLYENEKIPGTIAPCWNYEPMPNTSEQTKQDISSYVTATYMSPAHLDEE